MIFNTNFRSSPRTCNGKPRKGYYDILLIVFVVIIMVPFFLLVLAMAKLLIPLWVYICLLLVILVIYFWLVIWMMQVITQTKITIKDGTLFVRAVNYGIKDQYDVNKYTFLLVPNDLLNIDNVSGEVVAKRRRLFYQSGIAVIDAEGERVALYELEGNLTSFRRLMKMIKK